MSTQSEEHTFILGM